MPKFRPLPPLQRLSELLEVVEIPPDKYGVWSGLVWKVRRGGKANAGSVAGRPQPNNKNPGRVDWVVGIDNVYYVVSRVIYFMTYKEDPGSVQVDHKDQNWLNNNAQNLRLSTDASVQKINSPIRRDNTSGVTGVSWDEGSKKWKARAKIKNKLTYLGRFTCKHEAARVLNEKWIELGWVELGRKLNDLETIACDCGKCT